MARWAGWAKRALKSAAAGAVHYSGLRSVLARASRVSVGGRRVLIVSYHRVVEDFEREARRAIPGLLISRDTFGRHIDELRASGFESAPLGQALDAISGRSTPKKDLAVLTFDDGYADVYEHAFPVLKEKGAPATVYLATGFVGTDRRFLHDRLFHLSYLGLKGGGGGGGG
ncbi:MAG: polysaccharide deacetylase family protein, partial [Myxococcales bacterium]